MISPTQVRYHYTDDRTSLVKGLVASRRESLINGTLPLHSSCTQEEVPSRQTINHISFPTEKSARTLKSDPGSNSKCLMVPISPMKKVRASAMRTAPRLDSNPLDFDSFSRGEGETWWEDELKQTEKHFDSPEKKKKKRLSIVRANAADIQINDLQGISDPKELEAAIRRFNDERRKTKVTKSPGKSPGKIKIIKTIHTMSIPDCPVFEPEVFENAFTENNKKPENSVNKKHEYCSPTSSPTQKQKQRAPTPRDVFAKEKPKSLSTLARSESKGRLAEFLEEQNSKPVDNDGFIVITSPTQSPKMKLSPPPKDSSLRSLRLKDDGHRQQSSRNNKYSISPSQAEKMKQLLSPIPIESSPLDLKSTVRDDGGVSRRRGRSVGRKTEATIRPRRKSLGAKLTSAPAEEDVRNKNNKQKSECPPKDQHQPTARRHSIGRSSIISRCRSRSRARKPEEITFIPEETIKKEESLKTRVIEKPKIRSRSCGIASRRERITQ